MKREWSNFRRMFLGDRPLAIGISYLIPESHGQLPTLNYIAGASGDYRLGYNYQL